MFAKSRKQPNEEAEAVDVTSVYHSAERCLPSSACFHCSENKGHRACFFSPMVGLSQSAPLQLVSVAH